MVRRDYSLLPPLVHTTAHREILVCSVLTEQNGRNRRWGRERRVVRELTAEQRFVEDFGLFLEQVGFPRIAGRILGLLLVNGVPMHLEQISAVLEVSRASVSTNTRLLIGVMLIEQRTQPGDRRTWFVVRPDAFRRRFGFIITQFASMSHWS